MSSVRFQILDAIVARLNATRPAGVPEFARLKTVPTEADAHPAASVYPSDEIVEPVSNRVSPLRQRTLSAYVEIRVAGNDPEVIADPILCWITAQLDNQRLGNLCHEIVEKRVQWRVIQREVPFMLILVALDIPYTTRTGNQELAR